MEDSHSRLLRERLRRLVEENIRLEQRLLQLGDAESSRVRETNNNRSPHQFLLDFDRVRPVGVLSQLELRRGNNPAFSSRSITGDYPALTTADRQRQELLLRELAAGRERTDRFSIQDRLRHQQGLEERLRDLERSARLEEIQRGQSSLHQFSSIGQFGANNESILSRLVPTANDQGLLRRLPYAAAASMPMERSEASSPSSKMLDPPRNSKSEDGVVLVALDADGDFLTKYQVVLRQCLEFCTAQAKDVETSVQGRKHKLRVGQIGLRCRFCCHLPVYQRGRGSVHFVKNIRKIYQAAQNMSTTHFISSCSCIPKDLRARLAALRGIREMGKVGNIYWMDSCRDMGIVEHDGALWWKHDEGTLWSKHDIAASFATTGSATSDGSDKGGSDEEDAEEKAADEAEAGI